MSRTGSGPAPFALLGRPVEHSLSPRLHRRAFRELGRDACYVALASEEGEVEPLMRALARSGGGGNVTVPHKERAAGALDAPSEAVRSTGACNCFWWDAEGGLAGDNTDVEGFSGAMGELLGGARPLEDGVVLLLGAGGGARAVAHACLEGGVARLDVLNRTTRRARGVAERLGDERLRVLADRGAVEGPYDLVVNATSLGLRDGDPLPFDLSGLRAGAAFDLVYGDGGTAWTGHAGELGIRALDGREMLVRQAAASLLRWFGEAPPLGTLREALREGE